MIHSDLFCPQCGCLWDMEVCENPECGYVSEEFRANKPRKSKKDEEGQKVKEKKNG